MNKTDLEDATTTAAELAREWPRAYAISAVTGTGCREVLEAAAALMSPEQAVADETTPDAAAAHRVYQHRPSRVAPAVVREDGAYRVISDALERIVAVTDMDSEEAVVRLQQRMRRMGVDAALAAAGCSDGDTVRIGDSEFTYVDDEAQA